MGQPRTPIVCLVPARNAESDIPGFMESVAHLADAVVALDDGSTDGTAKVLEGSPLVATLIRNPVRETYAGWDDSANRNRLLEAAAELEPEWIVSLDADERLDIEDARALREFLLGDALPGLVYGFQYFRMWGEDRFDPGATWIYRAFAFEPGLQFPGEPLHFNPVPSSLARDRWVRTSIRVKHYGAATEARRVERLRKYEQADPNSVYRTDFGGLSDRPIGALELWKTRPATLPVLIADPESLIEGSPSRSSNKRLIVLLPARNAEADLPGWLASVRAFADGVVALDDGSTDGTRAMLDADPLVARVLFNPRRETYEGWDDAANRQQLLDAARDLDPGWVLFLDSDERLDAGDGRALRAFVDGHAEPGFAYGFRVHRMTGDGTHYDRAGLWVYRMFAFEPDGRLPTRRLHLVPVPTSIPRDRWLRTTVRIQHFGASTDERRRARLEKYRAADPTEEFQSDYAQLTGPTVEPIRWEERPIDLPVLLDLPAERGTGSIEVTDLGALDGPVLSAVVIARNDERLIERAVRSVVEQECPFEFEVVVVVSGHDRTAAIVRERFPGVRLIELNRPALPGEARNAGVAVARGDFVSFPGSHVELLPGSLAARLRAHERGYPMVTGVVDNGTRTPAGWASYFLDHSANLTTAPSMELRGPPARCSYDRELLLAAGPFPEDMRAGEDTAVNVALWKRGAVAYRSNEIRFVHNSPCTTIPRLLKHHHTRGRALGRLRLQETSGRRPRIDATLWLAGYLPRRIGTTTRNVQRNGDAEMQQRYRRAMPLIVAACVSAWVGALAEVARTKSGDRR